MEKFSISFLPWCLILALISYFTPKLLAEPSTKLLNYNSYLSDSSFEVGQPLRVEANATYGLRCILIGQANINVNTIHSRHEYIAESSGINLVELEFETGLYPTAELFFQSKSDESFLHSCQLTRLFDSSQKYEFSNYAGPINLSRWYLSIPTDTDGNGKADNINPDKLQSGYENRKYFFVRNNGLVFKTPIKGVKTSKNTKYTRVELREILGKGKISSYKDIRNNWVLSSAPKSEKEKAGGIDGRLEAEVSVDRVTKTGKKNQVGRTIIGQIHGKNDELCRLYYRKLPGNSKGSLYFAHEKNGGSESYYELIGSRSNNISNPSDGISLSEKFRYVIKVRNDKLTVFVTKGSGSKVSKTIDVGKSGYNKKGEYLYFKAGSYNQNNSGDDNDYTQVTFYSLRNTHE